MHLTFHYAIGVILAGILYLIQPINEIIFGFIIIMAMFPDLDFLFSKFAPDNNHRMLITHSLLVPVLIIILSAIFNNLILLFSGLAYFSHVVIDLVDWGNNFLGLGRLMGIRILIAPEERGNVLELLKQEKIPKWFFVRRYYQSPLIFVGELVGFLGMLSIFTLITPNRWYYIFGYILVLGVHLYEYYSLKNNAEKSTEKK
jgi:hypothetical protein